MKNKLFLIAAAVGALVLSGCGSKYPSVEPLKGDYVADFSKGESEEVFASDGWANGAPFNAVWKKENISYSDEAFDHAREQQDQAKQNSELASEQYTKAVNRNAKAESAMEQAENKLEKSVNQKKNLI